MIRPIIHTATLALAVCMATAMPAEAQLGGLGNRLKDKAKAAVENATGGTASSSESSSGSAAGRSPYSTNVLEITPALLDRARAVASASVQVRQQQAAYTAHEKCTEMELEKLKVAMHALNERYQAKLAAGDARAMMAMADTIQMLHQQVTTAPQQKCGPRPTYPEQSPQAAREQALKSQQLTERQYSVLEERVVFFCRSEQASRSDGAVQVPGDGRNIFWVYSASEVEAIKPRCGELLPLLGE
jgi:hypothetical protein